MTKINKELVESFDTKKHRKKSIENLEQSWPLYRDTLKLISKLTLIPADKLNNYLRTIFFLLLLGLLFPFNLLITLITLLFSKLIPIDDYQRLLPKTNPNSKRILISGGMMTKALQLCRAFHSAGHRVILVDDPINWLTGHRWSNAVERFYVVPPADAEPEEYIKTLKNIVQREKIDMFVPVTGPYHSHVDSQAKVALEAIGCPTFHMSSDVLSIVDDKFSFTETARSLGLTVPKSFLITSRQQLLDFNFDRERRPFICKALVYDWLDRNVIVPLPRPTRGETVTYINSLPISKDCPYILQEFIQGTEYCTHGTCLDGQLTIYTCCLSSAWQLNYKHIDHPEIFNWCEKYVRGMKLTGHASFDFIVSDDDGKAYAIECNPRVHSAITAFYNHPDVVNGYLSPALAQPLIPRPSARETYWLTHELWRIFYNLRSMEKVRRSLQSIIYGKEAIWSWNDPLPFLLHYHVHIVFLLLENLRPSRGRFFRKIDCCIGELS